jgi:hypothetical protein
VGSQVLHDCAHPGQQGTGNGVSHGRLSPPTGYGIGFPECSSSAPHIPGYYISTLFEIFWA